MNNRKSCQLCIALAAFPIVHIFLWRRLRLVSYFGGSYVAELNSIENRLDDRNVCHGPGRGSRIEGGGRHFGLPSVADVSVVDRHVAQLDCRAIVIYRNGRSFGAGVGIDNFCIVDGGAEAAIISASTANAFVFEFIQVGLSTRTVPGIIPLPPEMFMPCLLPLSV